MAFQPASASNPLIPSRFDPRRVARALKGPASTFLAEGRSSVTADPSRLTRFTI